MCLKKSHSKLLPVLFFLTLCSCASILDVDDAETLEVHEEYEEMVIVKKIPPDSSAEKKTEDQKEIEKSKETKKKVKTKAAEKIVKPEPSKKKLKPARRIKEKVRKVKKEEKAVDQKVKTENEPHPEVAKPAEVKPHLPAIEDSAGFIGRRPISDPFRVGEKVTLALTYFNITAGYLTLEVRPFVEVNGEKSYHFVVTVKSNATFSLFYAVDDWSETFVTFAELLPVNLAVHVKESKQLKEIRSFFDFKTNEASYWEKKITKDGGEKKKKKRWKIKPFSQNVISAVFYLRSFQLEPDKTLAFRVADEGKNMVFKGKVLRREEIDTPEGRLKTVVVKPEIEVDGIFKPMGDIFLWLTDDDRKFIVKIESKIKIGTIVGKLRSIEKGSAP